VATINLLLSEREGAPQATRRLSLDLSLDVVSCNISEPREDEIITAENAKTVFLTLSATRCGKKQTSVLVSVFHRPPVTHVFTPR